MMNILIVDDEKPILNLIRISLSNAGYLCDTAADGNQALEKIDNGKYDLILLDIMLPEVDGFELMENMSLKMLDLFQTLLINLLDNAKKAMEQGGKIIVVVKMTP